MADTDRADAAVRYALNQARRSANFMRLNGLGANGWLAGYEFGSASGQLLVALYDMAADPILAEGARNEISFLLNGNYVSRGHA